MKNPILRSGLLMGFLLSASMSFGQIQTPQASPAIKVTTTVGLTDVVLEYSRPGVKGRDRKIFGGLVPYGEVWRTGANAATKVTFGDSVKIKDQWLPGGTYALYTIPEKGEWTVVFSRNTDLWGSMGYSANDDALRVKIKPGNLTEPAETFTIDFANYTTNGANMNIMWDFTKVSVPIETEVDKKVMAQIQKVMASPQEKSGPYYTAANYYYRNGKDKNQALQWIDQAIAKDDRYFYQYLKALILTDLNRPKEAIQAAEKSKAGAQKEKNPEYVKMNDELIARLNKNQSNRKK
ncbi:DUF2911 domain-containing protein [Cesiribacter andamanensis]|uniref:DUF2911 domain-containing protein n=1 Tax=Cesiribacter andamanensis AMV16 TaxID=1279009 RepID=M7N777_9BACT|nr:DUF2911 domain-containing protein [Cesiribacter andamanensis]EMR04468.1 hypothetical protein ADICEAN_00366 [Cesiribacter andamanensis AMV16]